MRRFLWACVVTLGVVLAIAPLADAQTMRSPKTGSPAMVLDVPAGWTAKFDDLGNLQYSSADHGLNIQLTMIVDDAVRSTSLAEIATDIFKEGQLPPYTRTQPWSIAGRAGEAFWSKKTYPSGGSVNFMVILVKLGPTAVASIGRVTRDGLTAAQQAPVDAAMSKIRFIGVE